MNSATDVIWYFAATGSVVNDHASKPKVKKPSTDLRNQSHDGALVYMTYGGRYVTPPDLKLQLADTLSRHRIDPARYYFRTNPIFETGSKQYAWLNDVVCVGIGYLIERGVAYKVFRVL